MAKCSNPKCNAPEVTCDFGEPDHTRCKYWELEDSEENEANTTLEIGMHLPWTGSAFGLTDIGFLSGSTKPKVVGIIGAENAGKTTLLASWFLLISRGISLKIDRQFSGSYSLAGWESISDNLRWGPGNNPPSFPSHTPSGIQRSPGLLHVEFKDINSNVTQDYLFADAPGEWFKNWAVNSESPDAEGARWIAENADIFLLTADREALNKGRARSEFSRLAQRLGGEVRGRPVALVWTKSDVPLDITVVNSIKENICAAMPDVVEFKTRVVTGTESKFSPEEDILRLLGWIVEQEDQKGKKSSFKYAGQDPFFMFGIKD